MSEAALRARFGGEGLARVLARARDRLEKRDLVLDGAFTIENLSEREREELGALLGRTVGDGRVRVRLADLDAAIARMRYGTGLAGVLDAIGPPLRARAGEADRIRRVRQAPFDAVLGHPAIARHPRLAIWLDQIRRRGTLARAGRDPEGLLAEALAVLERLPADDIGLAVLAGSATGRTHALDRGEPLAALCDQAVAAIVDEPRPVSALDRRALWARVGVILDEVSATVLALGLRTDPALSIAPLLAAAADAGQPLPLTLRMLRGIDVLPAVGAPVVYACENPAVIEAAAARSFAPPLICLSGVPTSAGLRLVDALRAGGAEVRYHGDFDWEGVRIANALIQRGVRPWRFATEDYIEAIARTPVLQHLVGVRQQARWDGRLADVMEATDATIYEEQVLDALLADPRRDELPVAFRGVPRLRP